MAEVAMTEVALTELAPNSQASTTAPNSNSTSVEGAPAPAHQHPYLEFLTHLHSKWTDVPRLTVAYQDFSVVFQKPLRSGDDSAADTDEHGHPKNTITADSVPTLWTTLQHYARLPVDFVATRTGLRVDPPLYSMKKVNGVIRPGTMTLVLAPPGHGKSTYLKVRRHDITALHAVRALVRALVFVCTTVTCTTVPVR